MYMKAVLGIFLYSYPLTQLAKTLCLPYSACLFSSTKLAIKAEQDVPGTEGGREERVGEGDGGRNDPNNVCTCE
jgi:hypothetical protein